MDSSVVVLTRHRVLVVDELFGSSELTWQCPLSDVVLLQIEMDKKVVTPMDLVRDSTDTRTTFLTTQQQQQQDTDRRTRRLRSLSGKPFLHLFHTIHRTPGFRVQKSPNRHSYSERSSTGDCDDQKEAKRGLEQKVKSTDSTDRLIKRTLPFNDHENLVEFLEILLEIAPILEGKETEKYFNYCGMKSSTQKNEILEKRKKHEDRNIYNEPSSKKPGNSDLFFSSQVEVLGTLENEEEIEIEKSIISSSKNIFQANGETKIADKSNLNKFSEEDSSNIFFAKIDYNEGKIILIPVIEKNKK